MSGGVLKISVRQDFHTKIVDEFVASLALPVLLVLGLFTCFAAAGLFILNGVLVISYYSELGEAELNQYLYWEIMLAVLLVISCSRWTCGYLSGEGQGILRSEKPYLSTSKNLTIKPKSQRPK